jgi:hypothetical protein
LDVILNAEPAEEALYSKKSHDGKEVDGDANGMDFISCLPALGGALLSVFSGVDFQGLNRTRDRRHTLVVGTPGQENDGHSTNPRIEENEAWLGKRPEMGLVGDFLFTAGGFEIVDRPVQLKAAIVVYVHLGASYGSAIVSTRRCSKSFAGF